MEPQDNCQCPTPQQFGNRAATKRHTTHLSGAGQQPDADAFRISAAPTNSRDAAHRISAVPANGRDATACLEEGSAG